MKLILTCEHGGNEIPHTFQPYFENENTILNSHRGYDLGALDVFQKLKPLSDFSKYSKTSRLLIELNRSLHCPNLFSKFTKQLSKKKKKPLLIRFIFFIETLWNLKSKTTYKTINRWFTFLYIPSHLSSIILKEPVILGYYLIPLKKKKKKIVSN